jgi:hypothetical protein
MKSPMSIKMKYFFDIEKEYNSNDNVGVYINAYYYRPETEEETLQREERIKKQIEGKKSQELKLLAELKAKYE